MPKGRRWTNLENETLARAWLVASNRHVSTKSRAFWECVHDEFCALAPKYSSDGLFRDRSPSMIPKQFGKMVSDMKSFHSTLKMVFTKQPPGMRTTQRIRVAVQIHLGQATNPNRAFVDFNAYEWPNYEAWLTLKDRFNLSVPNFVPARTAEEIAAALAPRTVSIRKSTTGSAVGDDTTVASVVAVTPAPGRGPKVAGTESATGDDSPKGASIMGETRAVATPNLRMAPAVSLLASDAEGTVGISAQVLTTVDVQEHGAGSITFTDDNEDVVELDQDGENNVSSVQDAPSGDSNETTEPMVTNVGTSVEENERNEQADDLSSIASCLSTIDKQLKSNKRQLDLIAYLVLHEREGNGDELEKVKKARNELQNMCDLFQ
jgi:hypothetical protein